MNLVNLLRDPTPVAVGIIGAGTFGRAFFTQALVTPRLALRALCDRDLELALELCREAGVAGTELAVCNTGAEARRAYAAGKLVVAADGRLLAELPLEAVVEATGVPEAAAVHALAAIQAGQHVIMATKEADVVTGPTLARRAREAGVVYTLADGDQPALLLGLLAWAEALGLEVICAGKASEADLVYDPARGMVGNGRQAVPFPADELWQVAPDDVAATLDRRRAVLSALPLAHVADLCEMAMVINGSGYGYDCPTFHRPVVRIPEVPQVLCPRAAGGILEQDGVIDVVHCLRRGDEAGFAGGVFVVVRCHDLRSWQMLARKGHLLSPDGRYGLLYVPRHLLGVETATSVLAASRLGISVLPAEAAQRVDLLARAARDLPAGTRLRLDRDHALPGVVGELGPASPLAGQSPLPFYLAAGRTLQRNVPAGALLTCDAVEEPGASTLWALRMQPG